MNLTGYLLREHGQAYNHQRSPKVNPREDFSCADAFTSCKEVRFLGLIQGRILGLEAVKTDYHREVSQSLQAKTGALFPQSLLEASLCSSKRCFDNKNAGDSTIIELEKNWKTAMQNDMKKTSRQLDGEANANPAS